MSLPTQYQQYIHTSRYARWNEKEKRRETWEETVQRYVDFFEEHLKEECNFDLPLEEKELVKNAILNLEVMPSMRALWTAGPALRRDQTAGYNCSAIAIDKQSAFDEILYILMCGTGVGFSVERQFVNQLPVVAEEFHETNTLIIVDDSKIGWAKSLKELISLLYNGQIPKWDTTKLRPAGAKLKTFGGRSSGPAPLVDLFKFTVNLFKNAAGRKLTSLECHDLVCKIAEIVVVGGVRRSALISLSNLSDDRMRMAKSGNWWEHNVQRALSNNSAAYTEKPDIGIFMKEWLALYDSKSGERGIFNRQAAKKQLKKNGRRDPEHDWLTNPCAEILLRSSQYCNLSEAIIRDTDTKDDILRKVKIATIIGTWQSTLTKFRYISKKWQRNCEEERLLGVSLTGIMDHELLSGQLDHEELKVFLDQAKHHTIAVNKEYAEKLGIPVSAAITCTKPSGTVSQLCDTASGIHARHSPFYIRRVRQDKKDPLGIFLFNAGIPAEDDVTKPNHTWVFSFPVKSPEHSVFRHDMTAIEQLEIWKIYRKYWCEHNPSVTISVKEHEWMEVGAWVYSNFDEVCGLSFLPYSDANYKQMPYEECSEEEYNDLVSKMPNINWDDLMTYEQEDNTEGAGNFACVSGNCEL
jgi:ribonucleoside-triphosphate reductase (thioredoxin)